MKRINRKPLIVKYDNKHKFMYNSNELLKEYNLTPFEKLLYYTLCDFDKGCYASIKSLAQNLEVSEQYIKKGIAKLTKCGLIGKDS